MSQYGKVYTTYGFKHVSKYYTFGQKRFEFLYIFNNSYSKAHICVWHFI